MEEIQRTEVRESKNTQTTQATNSLTTEFIHCPLFTGRHKWSLLSFRLSHARVSYCQFCFLEKLVPFAYNNLTEYYPAGTYYSR